jgi:hypothetical protein
VLYSLLRCFVVDGLAEECVSVVSSGPDCIGNGSDGRDVDREGVGEEHKVVEAESFNLMAKLAQGVADLLLSFDAFVKCMSNIFDEVGPLT